MNEDNNILVYGQDAAEHESRLQTLNKGKYQFYQLCVTFLGHVINEERISPDLKKTAAIQEMPQPSSVTELSKFSPIIAHLSKPHRELLSSKTMWVWTVMHF